MKCNLCPRNCNIDRDKGEIGYCGAPNELVIARYSLHMWEEPIISGDNGSGTIFFSYCNMRCCFCQNYEISELHKGRIVSIEEFSDICLELQDKGANNINLVTPTHYIYKIVDGIKLAKKKGLNIPIVYNSSGYENIDTIKMLDGLIDIYLPDLKYYDDIYSKKYSKCNDYFKYASMAIDEMFSQKGECIFDNDGNIISGVIVRHLLLPGMEDDSKKILKYLYDKYGDKIYISIMNQYTPINKCIYEELNNKVSNDIYDDVIDYAWNIGIRNAFIQDEGTQSESFIPDFDLNSLTE